jgi:hypothetical protein
MSGPTCFAVQGCYRWPMKPLLIGHFCCLAGKGELAALFSIGPQPCLSLALM